MRELNDRAKIRESVSPAKISELFCPATKELVSGRGFMQGLKVKHFIGLIIMAVMAVLLCSPRESAAVTWGSTTPSGCDYGSGRIVKVFPDYTTAIAAQDRDWLDAVNAGIAPIPGGITEGSCTGTCKFGNVAWSFEYGVWTVYAWPRLDCPDTSPPVQIPDVSKSFSPRENRGAMCPYSKFEGNPVNVATGNKYEPVLDLSISTPGIPFEFRRYYNSILATDGPLGYGWTHSYSISAKIVTSWTLGSVETPIRIKITNADGRVYLFSRIFKTYTDGDHYYGESGVRDRLVRNLTTNHLFLRKKDSNLTYEFGSDGKLLQITDTNGNSITLTYTSGLLTQVSNNFGKTLTFAYTGSHIQTITDPKGQVITYSYTSNDLTGVSYPDSRSIGYAYSNHNLTDKKDAANNIMGHWDYNTDGKVSLYYRYLKDGVPQEQATFDYTSSGTTLTRSTGTTTYATAVNDGINTVTDVQGCASCGGGEHKTYGFDSFVNLTDVTSIDNGQSYTTHYTYDNPTNFYDHLGEVTSITEAYGRSDTRTTTYSYTHRTDDPFLLTQSVETKSSVAGSGSTTITTAYDNGGNVQTRTETGYVLINGSPVQQTSTTSYQYNTNGQLTLIDGPRTDVNDTITYTYYPNTTDQGNNRGQLHTVTNALNQTTTYSGYDANGNVGTITDPNGVITQMTYDARNRLLTSTNLTTGALRQNVYDSHGNLSYSISPEGNRIDYTYNAGDKLTEIKDNLNNKIEYYYDPEGNKNREEILDPQGTLKKYLDYTYDTDNRLKRIINPDSTYTEFGYDQRGNRTTVQDPKTNTTTTMYDAFGRPYTTTQPLSTITGYGYDSQDNQTTVTDPNGNATQYWFDDFGNKNATTSPDTGTSAAIFDPAGNMTQRTDANGIVINYTYDVLNRITSVQFPADTTQNVTYSYDSTAVTYGIGKLTGRVDSSGSYVFYYDSQGNMNREDKTISGATYTTQYGYNKDNILTSITYPSGRVVTYSLNATGRVNQVSTPIGGTSKALASSITYLPFGGITNMTYDNNQALTQTWDNQYRISSIMVDSLFYLTYGYDENGNVDSILDAVNPTSSGPTETPGTFTYEQGSNVLTAITGSSPVTYDSDPNGNRTLENNRTYAYDLLNRLVTVSDNGTQIASYAYNALNQRTKKVTTAGTKIFHYDARGHLIAETTSTGQTLVEYVYLGDQPLAMVRPGEAVYYYHNDHLGTPRVMTNSSGAVAWKALYGAFGAATIATGNVENNLRFPGQYFDIETAKHYNWNRYYDPTTGSYITADPIGLKGGINPFWYSSNDPINKKDVNGLMSDKMALAQAIEAGNAEAAQIYAEAIGLSTYAILQAVLAAKAISVSKSEALDIPKEECSNIDCKGLAKNVMKHVAGDGLPRHPKPCNDLLVCLRKAIALGNIGSAANQYAFSVYNKVCTQDWSNKYPNNTPNFPPLEKE